MKRPTNTPPMVYSFDAQELGYKTLLLANMDAARAQNILCCTYIDKPAQLKADAENWIWRITH